MSLASRDTCACEEGRILLGSKRVGILMLDIFRYVPWGGRPSLIEAPRSALAIFLERCYGRELEAVWRQELRQAWRGSRRFR